MILFYILIFCVGSASSKFLTEKQDDFQTKHQDLSHKVTHHSKNHIEREHIDKNHIEKNHIDNNHVDKSLLINDVTNLHICADTIFCQRVGQFIIAQNNTFSCYEKSLGIFLNFFDPENTSISAESYGFFSYDDIYVKELQENSNYCQLFKRYFHTFLNFIIVKIKIKLKIF